MLSKNTIFSRLRKGGYYILNALTQQADILSEEEGLSIERGVIPYPEAFRDKGYVMDEEEENALFREKYLAFLDNREKEEVQVFFAPWYVCNFNCSYCYQKEYSLKENEIENQLLDAFVESVKKRFSLGKFYVTLFGGEPLLGGNYAKERIEAFVNRMAKEGIGLAVVTNGYELSNYIDILSKARLREIQVTLDGTKEVQNKRRSLHGGGETFNKVVEGIDKALEKGITINLRFVVDKDNIEEIIGLSEFAKERGWTSKSNFKTQIGRNYELHCKQGDGGHLFTRLSLYEKLYEIIEENPVVLDFHKPAFSIAKFLYESGDMPAPLFDSCPACKTEWAYSGNGKIYPCTANVGKDGEEVGSFFPTHFIDEEKTEEWQSRDILAIEKCRSCTEALLCGGGCAAVCKSRGEGIIGADCRPVEALLSLGISLYFQK